MDVSNDNQTEASTYFSRESTLSQYDIEAWFEEQYDTLKPHTASMILHIMENADFGSMYTDSLDEERNVVVVPMQPDYFSQHIPLESTLLQYLVLIEDGEILQSNLFIYFPEDPLFEEIPAGGIRDFYYNAHQFLDQSGRLKVLTISDMKLGEFEYEAGVLHTSTVLSSEWDEAGSIEYERRCQDWHVVRYYFDLQTGEILDSEVIAEGNTCDNECPPGEMFCDEGMGGGAGPEEPNWVSVNKEITVTVFENTNTFGVSARLILHGKNYPGFTSLNTFTAVPTVIFNSGTVTCYNFHYCMPDHVFYRTPTSASGIFSIQNSSKISGKVNVVLKVPKEDPEEEELYPKAFTWIASTALN